MSRRLAAFVFLFTIGCGGSATVGGTGGAPSSEVSARQLADAYQAELNADQKYRGKRILVTEGMVTNTAKDKNGDFADLGGFHGETFARCYYASAAAAAKLTPRSAVNVLGTCQGLKGGVVTLTDCETVEDLAKYRPIPKGLVARFDGLKPSASFQVRDDLRNSIKTMDGRVVEIPGLFGVANNGETYMGGVCCRFSGPLTKEVEKVGNAWPVSIRGQVKGNELIDCGLKYGYGENRDWVAPTDGKVAHHVKCKKCGRGFEVRIDPELGWTQASCPNCDTLNRFTIKKGK